MNKISNIQTFLSFRSSVISFLLIIFIASLIFPLRAITSISLALIILFSINKTFRSCAFNKNHLLLLLACLIFLVLQIIGISYSTDFSGAMDNLQLKTGIVFVPVALLLVSNVVSQRIIKISFITLLCIAAITCIAIACFNYFYFGDPNDFIYHGLVVPIRQHAVYMSILVFFVLILLTDPADINIPSKPRVALFILFSGFLLLLASRLMIGLYVIYALINIISRLRNRKRIHIGIVPGSIVLFAFAFLFISLKNPVSARFKELINTDLSILKKERFGPSMYFNGLQFRILQWKIAWEIVRDENAWIAGVGPGGSQQAIDEKYVAMDMYLGDVNRKGYPGYNSHNQFLETFIQNGIPGIIALSAIWIGLFNITRKQLTTLLMTAALFLWSLTESILETQYGIVYLFLPLLFLNLFPQSSQPPVLKRRLDEGEI